MYRLLACWLLLSPLLSLAGWEKIHGPLPADAMQVSQYRLDNGLTVFLSPNHETPRFYAEIVVRAGSAVDPAETTGLAHYLEHLLFKGNRAFGTVDYEKEQPHLDRIRELYEAHYREKDPEQRAVLYADINTVAQEAAQYAIPNEFDTMYSALGATAINAHTSTEETVYKVSLPANRLPQWAEIESSRFVHPVFRLFHTELETVYEEKNRAMDHSSRLLWENVYRELFPVHPYGQQTTLGEAEHLKSPSLVNIRAFYDTWYVPNNMALCLSGNVDPETAMPMIDQYFGIWKRRDLPAPVTYQDPGPQGVKRVTVTHPAEPMVMLAFRTVPIGHPDQPALQMLDMVLANATAGLLDLHLTQSQKVRMAGAYPWFQQDAGAQHFYAIPKPGDTPEQAEELILEQLDLLRKGGFDHDLLPAILTDFRKNHLRGLEEDAVRVSRMRDAFISRRPWSEAIGEIERLSHVTPEQIVAVAHTYFSGDAYVAGYRTPGEHTFTAMKKPPIDPIPIDATRRSDFARNVLAKEIAPLKPHWVQAGRDYHDLDLSETLPGVTLRKVPNPVNQLFDLVIRIEAGTRQHPELALLPAIIAQAGTKDLSPAQLKRAWYALGADFAVAVGDDITTITLRGFDDRIDGALALASSVVKNPVLKDGALDQIKQVALKEREELRTNPASLLRAFVNYQRYGKDSPQHTWLPGEKVKELRLEDALQPLHRLLYQAAVQVDYVGTVDAAQMVKLLAKQWERADDAGKQPARPKRQTRTPEETELWFLHQKTAQSQVRIEWNEGAWDPAAQARAALFNEYFGGGMSSLVFQELREARALAYSAWAYYVSAQHPEDPNLVIGQISCQPDKTVDAVSAFLDLFDDMPATQQRFTSAQQGLSTQWGTERLSFRNVPAAVAKWERMGLKQDPRPLRLASLHELSLADLEQFHAARIKGTVRRISVVGDRDRIDLEALKKVGAFREIQPKDCFGP